MTRNIIIWMLLLLWAAPASATITGRGGNNPTPPPLTLYWARPALSSPTTWHVPDGNTSSISYSGNVDLIVDLSSHVTGSVTVNGGQNIVVIGGVINAPAGTTQVGTLACMYFTPPLSNVLTGRVISIEGVWCKGGGTAVSGTSGESDGFDFRVPEAIVQLQYSRADGLFGWADELHSDCLQPYGGTLKLLVYNFTCHGGYQGLSVKSDTGPNPYVEMHRVNADINFEPQTTGAHSNGGFILWIDNAVDCSDIVDDIFDTVYIGSNRAEAQTLQGVPITAQSGLVHTNSCTALVGSLTGSVGVNNTNVTGTITYGMPPAGDYVTVSLMQNYPPAGLPNPATPPGGILDFSDPNNSALVVH